MAVSTSSYFSNSIVGAPQLGADIDLYAAHTSPKYQVGFGITRGDGNKFRYSHFGALTAAGALTAVDRSESDQYAVIKAGALAASLTKVGGETMNVNAIGSRYAALVITATAHQFAGGYLVVHSGTGFGFTYHIKDNDATSAQITSNTVVQLYDPIVVALDSNSEITITGHNYANLEPITTTDPCPAGVAVTNVSASGYGWVQTRGPVGVLQDATIGTIAKGLVSVSSNTTGAVGIAGASLTGPNYPIVGYLLNPGTSAAYSTVFLTLE
jgi:hypothetical protein